jgi:hypothetical protein
MGQLQIFIFPQPNTGNKTCQVIDVPIKPLNLHGRVDKIEQEVLDKLPLSSIDISGKFSMSDAH